MTRAQKVEKSLKEQLKRKKIDVYHFEKLVEDYCALFEIAEKLKEDIKNRGVTITEKNVKGFDVTKTNPDIAELTRVNNQMLKILATLGSSPKETIMEDGEDDGL